MPGGDRTGPMGTGPMTGRGAGYCAGYDAAGSANAAPGRCMGFGHQRGFAGRGFGFGGGGRGHRHWFYATGMPGWMRFGRYPSIYPLPTAETEKQVLKSRADALQSELDAVKKRLAEF